MPGVIDMSDPLAHVLANAGGAGDDLAGFLEQKKQTDQYLENAKARLLLERASSERAQQQHEYSMGRAPIEDAQRDARAKIDETLGRQRIEANEQTLGRGTRDDSLERDSDVQLFTQEAEKLLAGVDDGEGARKIRSMTDTRAGLLRNYALEEPDPARRAALRRAQAGRFLELTQNEALPHLRSTVERELSEAGSRGYLQTNARAHSAIERLQQDLKNGKDPREVRDEYSKLSANVAADQSYLEDQQDAAGEIDGMLGVAGALPYATRAEMRTIKNDIATGRLKPSEGIEKARKLALGGHATPAERLTARKQAFDELRRARTRYDEDKARTFYDPISDDEIDARTRKILGEPESFGDEIPFGRSAHLDVPAPDELGAQPDDASTAAPAAAEEGAPAPARTPNERASIVKRPRATPAQWDAAVAELAKITDPAKRIRALEQMPYNPFLPPAGAKEIEAAPSGGSVLDHEQQAPSLWDKLRAAAASIGAMRRGR